jgi:hypothetical protein
MNRLSFFPLAALVCTAAPLQAIDECFDDNIKSIRLHREGAPFAEPVLTLDSDDRLLLTFDDLCLVDVVKC